MRHHTDDEGLAGIKAEGAIHVSRGWGLPGGRGEVEWGVHVEVEPFGTAISGANGPIASMSTAGEGAYVEFDLPVDRVIIQYKNRYRNMAVIATRIDEPLSLEGLNPSFVRVQRHWWQFWRG